MPYTDRRGGWERARRLAHVPIVESEFVRERLANFRVMATGNPDEVDAALLTGADDLECADPLPRWVMSFDGSPSEVAVREEYPSTRIVYLQIAGVLVHLEEMLGQGHYQLVDPAAIRAAVDEALYALVLPGSNVCRSGSESVSDSWRSEIFETLREYSIEDTPLLEIYMTIVSHSDKRSPTGGIIVSRCPGNDGCEQRDIDVAVGGSSCPRCGIVVYPTDALRIHEEVLEEHSNLTAIGRLMSVLEHLTMAGYLNFLLQRQPRALGSVAFVMDGPLALFGPQAWMHGAMQRFLQFVYGELTRQQFRLPIVVGLEKTGQFAEHAAALGDRITRRTLMALPDAYIYDHVLSTRGTGAGPFGRDTYYGQKFFYRTQQGQLLTLTTPKPTITGTDLHGPAHYSVLPATLRLLDQIGTSLYADAVIPVALAHSYASIPLRTGSRVLTLLSRQALAGGEVA
jgi:hypothetical protein